MSAKSDKKKKEPGILVKSKKINDIKNDVSIGIFGIRSKYQLIFAIGILAFVGAIVFSDFLLFHKIFFYKDIASDSINQSYPFLMHAAQYLKTYGVFSWSFNIGMGQNATSTFFYDPFNFILFAIGRSALPWLYGYIIYLEVILSGMCFYFYLRTLDRGYYSSLIGSLMFAFCGYIMVGSAWSFSSEGLIASTFLLGFERIFLKNKSLFFLVPVFFISLSRPFDFAIYAVFLFIYAAFRYLQENRRGFKGFAILILRMIFMVLLGICLCAPIFIEQIKVLLESARVSGTDSLFSKLFNAPMFDIIDQYQLGTAIQRFFSSEILGSGNNFKGWMNIFEAPAFYCGIPCLVLLPLLFTFLNKNQIKIYVTMLAVWVLPVIFPWFRHAIWLFSGDYYRAYSMFVALIFIIFSSKGLDEIISGKKLNIKVLILSVIILILVQKLSFFGERKVVDEQLSVAVDFFILAYAAIIFWISRESNKFIPMVVFLILFCTELSWFSYLSVNHGSNITAEEWVQKTGYNDYSVDAIKYLKTIDKSFFRIDKQYASSPAMHYSLNDGMAQDYYGTSVYNSFNQKYYIQYLKAYGVIDSNKESESRWSNGLVSRQFLENINDVKYIFIKDFKRGINHNIQDSVGTFGNVTVLRNKMTLPLGFCYGSFIKFSEFAKLSKFQKDILSFRAAVVNDADTVLVSSLKHFNLKDTIGEISYDIQKYENEHDSLMKYTLSITYFKPYKIVGKIYLKTAKLLYLSIPYDKGWHCMIDGKEQEPILIGYGMIGLKIGAGSHTIELDYKSQYRTEATFVSIFVLFVFAGLLIVNKRKS